MKFIFPQNYNFKSKILGLAVKKPNTNPDKNIFKDLWVNKGNILSIFT